MAQVHDQNAAVAENDAPDTSSATTTSTKRKPVVAERPIEAESNRRRAEINKITSSTELHSPERNRNITFGKNKVKVKATMAKNNVEEQGSEKNATSPADDDVGSESGMSSVSQPNRSKRLNKPRRQDETIEYDGPKLSAVNVDKIDKSPADERNERMQAWLRGLGK